MASGGGSTPHAPSRVMPRLRTIVLVGALLLASVAAALVAATRADAVHGRGFNVSWVRTSPDTARFDFKVAMRRDWFAGSAPDGKLALGDNFTDSVGGTVLQFGDNEYAFNMSLKVVAVNKHDNWVLAVAGHGEDPAIPPFSHKYKGTGAFTAFGAGCCMIAELVRLKGLSDWVDYRVNSLVDLAHDAESPVISVPPVVTLDDKGVQSWQLPTVDAGGQRLRYRLRTGIQNPEPPGAHIDPDTGVMEWNTTGLPDGLYQASVEVQALDPAGNVVSTSEASYLVRLAPVENGATPRWIDPTPPERNEYSVWSGESVDIRLQAFDPDGGQKVTINHLGLPGGATLNTSEDNPADASFHWTPKRDQAGDHLITFTADDDSTYARQTLRTVLVHVKPNAAPHADAGPDRTVDEGDVGTLDGSGTSDPENDPLTYRWTRLGGFGPSAALSSYSADKPSFQALDDGRSDFRLSVDDGRGGTASDTVSTVTRNIAPTVSSADANAYQGGASVLTTTFTDPGVLDTHTASIDWGDGSAVEPASVTQGSGWGSVVASHRYEQAGEYTANVTVADDDGGTGSTTAHVKVTRPAAIWANSTTNSPQFSWSGSHNRITGIVHSNGDLRVTGSDNRADTAEYAGVLDVRGASTNLVASPSKVGQVEMPVSFRAADYAPGGSGTAALSADSYFDESSKCSSPTSTFAISGANRELAPGVYYVPCNVSVSGTNLRGQVTIAATGKVSVSGSGHNLRSYADGLLFLSGAAGNNILELSGSGSTYSGTAFAGRGEVHISGSGLTYNGGIFADRIKLSGSGLQLSSGDSDPRPSTAVALATVVPNPQLGIDISSPNAVPGDTLTYKATLANAGATLIASGLFGAQDVGDASGSVKYYSYALEYLSAATEKWTPLAGTAAAAAGYTPSQPAPLTTGVSLATLPMPSAGVTYGTGDQRILDTALPARSLAAWAYQARVELTPEQVNLVYDPARVLGVRNHVHLEYSPGSAPIRPLYELGNDFAKQLRASSKDVTDAHLSLAPPTGDPKGFDPASTPSLARIAPGSSATAQTDYTVPALARRGDIEGGADYLARLAAADGAVMHGAARSTSASSLGRLFVPQVNASTTQHVPIVGLRESGPSQADAGSSPIYDLDLADTGSARADGIQIDDAIFGGGSTAVSDVPAGLDPGATHTAHATRSLPASVRGGVADRATAHWEDANGNRYGPAEDGLTTDVRSAASLKATKRAQLAIDADGNGVVSEGDTIEYTVTATNNAGSAATGVVFTDTPDATAPLDSATIHTSQGTVKKAAPITVELGTVAGGATATISFRVRVPSQLPDGVVAIRNQGTLKSSQGPDVLTDDPDAAGPVDPTLTPIHIRAPHVEAQQTATLADDADGNGRASAGDALEYAVTVQNAGDALATGVRLVDAIGQHLSLVPGSVETDSGEVVSGADAGDTDVQVAFARMQPLEKAHVHFRVRIDDALPTGVVSVSDQGYAVSNETGHARALTDDPTQPGDRDPTVTELMVTPRLEAQKTAALKTDADGNGVVSPGDTVHYAVRIANTSGTAATGVKLTDTPDPNTALVAGSATTSQGTVGVSGGALTAAVGGLAVDSEATVGFDVKLRDDFPAGTYRISNQGTVTSTERPKLRTDDPAAAGAADPTVTPVALTSSPPPALAATKTATLADDADGDRTPSPGDTLSYELRVANVGQGTASGVHVDDTPDPNTELVAGSVQVPSGTSVTTGNASGDTRVGVDLGHVAPGASRTVSFQVRVAGAMPAGVDSVRNQGEVTSVEVAPVLTQDPGGSAIGGATVSPISPPPKPAPAIRGVAPSDGAVLSQPTPVTAELAAPTGQSIESWCVRYELSGSTESRELKCGTGAPGQAALATFDPTTLPNGSYAITIEARASGGGEQSKTITVSVEGFQKPARYRTSYQDLAVPVFDLPMQVTRTYDSYDKEKGDFGIGWNAEVSSFRVQVNRPLGRGGWSFQQSGCRYLLGANFCTATDFKDLSSHNVTVTWPDGHDEVFDFTPHAGDAGVYYDANVGFTPRHGATSQIEPLEGGTTLQYWGAGNLFESDGTTPYDPQRFKLTAKDGTVYVLSVEKGLENFTDPHGNKLSVDDSGVSATNASGFTLFNQWIHFTRDSENRITKVTGPSNETRIYAYDTAGNLASATDGNGKTITYEYDADHNLKTLKDPAGRPFRTLTYDDAGRLTSITDGDGHTTHIETDPDGRQQVITDPAGTLTTVLSRDALGDVTSKREAADGSSRTTSYNYDQNGNVTRTVDPLGHHTRTTYDGAGNVLASTDELDRTTSFTYDALSQLTSVTRPDGAPAVQIVRDQYGDPKKIDAGLGRVTSLTYDPRGNLVAVSGPSGSASFDYDNAGVPYRVLSPAFSALISRDSSERIRTVNDQRNGRTDYTYDGEGNLIQRAQQPKFTVKYGYDYMGRLTSETDPLGKARSYTYDASGRPKTSTDRNGATTSYEYDAGGRLSRRNLGAGTAATQGYDGFGRTRTMENRDAKLSFDYDLADRLTGLTTSGVPGSDQPTTAIGYGYDDAGQMTSVTGPDGTAQYGYDGLGRLESLVDTDGGRFEFQRDPVGRLLRLTRPNGVTATTAWNAADQRTDVTSTGTGGDVIEQGHYSYAPGGFVTGLSDSAGSRSFGYQWGADLSSVSDATGQALESYNYDSNGNRTTNGSVYNAANRLVDNNAFGYTYDLDGRLTERRDKSALGAPTRFGWDAEGQLRSTTEPDGSITRYRYDPLGRRIEVAGPSGTRRFAYGAADNALAEYDGQNFLVATNTFDNGLDRPLSRHTGGHAYYQLQDGLDNVAALTDSQGAVVDRYRYSAFGQPVGDHDQRLNPYSFAGREWDAGSSTYYFRARYYDPAIGRFISEDPLETEPNPYSYAENDPLRFRDPTGLMSLAEQNEVQGELAEREANQAETAQVTVRWGNRGHGARHLKDLTRVVDQKAVERAVESHARAAYAQGVKQGAWFSGMVEAEGEFFVWRAYVLAEGEVNIGTYFPRWLQLVLPGF
jgi:RHS repeat-associated protein/uncharacterized repeat protein (TIGR01451 family)